MSIAEEQSLDPYAPPKAQADSGGASSGRRPWIAVLLAVLSPIYAMLYVGRGWRALGYLAASAGLVALSILLAAFVGLSPNTSGLIGSTALRIGGAVDGYRRAKTWPEPARLPWYARWSCLFPIMVVTVLASMSVRAFVVESFNILSGAMIPTLFVGDYILVNKSAYGLRLPLSEEPVMILGEPKHGDLAVFLYPENPELKYIKRVVGVPGDRVAYIDKRLSIDDRPMLMTLASDQSKAARQYEPAKQYLEDLKGNQHPVLINSDVPPVQLANVRQFPHRDACEYSERGFVCTVPPGHYFVLGDNRDMSSDKRYWGFAPAANLVGRAFMIWASTGRPERIGSKIQ